MKLSDRLVLTSLMLCSFRWRRWMWTLTGRAVRPGSWTPKIPSAPSAPSTRPPYSDWTFLSSTSPSPLTPFPFALCLHSLDRHDRTPSSSLPSTQKTPSPFSFNFSVCLARSGRLSSALAVQPFPEASDLTQTHFPPS